MPAMPFRYDTWQQMNLQGDMPPVSPPIGGWQHQYLNGPPVWGPGPYMYPSGHHYRFATVAPPPQPTGSSLPTRASLEQMLDQRDHSQLRNTGNHEALAQNNQQRWSAIVQNDHAEGILPELDGGNNMAEMVTPEKNQNQGTPGIICKAVGEYNAKITQAESELSAEYDRGKRLDRILCDPDDEVSMTAKESVPQRKSNTIVGKFIVGKYISPQTKEPSTWVPKDFC